MRTGLFPPDATIRTVSREAVLLAGGPRALLLQVAHPAVAAAVAEHSDFREDPLRRLHRTLELSLTMVFGTLDEARAAAAAVNAVHAKVTGPGYAASDPQLGLWVHATLVDTSLRLYELLVRRMPDADAEAYYQEGKLVAGLLGITDEVLPASLAAFRAYWSAMLGELHVTEAARTIAATVLRPRLPGVPGPVYRLGDAITAALLPPHLRAAYGLPYGPAERLAFAVWRDATRVGVRLVPPRLRAFPWSRRAV